MTADSNSLRLLVSKIVFWKHTIRIRSRFIEVAICSSHLDLLLMNHNGWVDGFPNKLSGVLFNFLKFYLALGFQYLGAVLNFSLN
jgi:hypothetical protein